MAKGKGTDAAWDRALQTATPKVGRRAAKPETATGTLFASIPATDLEDLRDLSRRLSRERAQRVTVAALTAEAVRDLLAKHRKPGR